MINSDPVKAHKLADSALVLALKLNNDTLIYESRHNKAVANYFLSNKNAALEDFIKNKSLAQKLNSTVKLIESLNAIGNMYKQIDRHDKALETYHEARKISVASKNQQKTSLIESNIAILYAQAKQMDSSTYYAYRVLRTMTVEQSKNSAFTASIYGVLVHAFIDKRNKDSVSKYAKITLSIYKESDNAMGYAGTLYNLGTFYFKLKDFAMADKYFAEAEATNPDNLELGLSIMKAQGDVLYALKKYETAAEYFGDVIALKDSVNKLTTVEKLAEMEVKYETGKKEEELKRISAEQEINTLKMKQSKMLTLISVISVLVCIIIATILFRQNKNKQEANKLLRVQNSEISHQKKEITDSINYAKRIQLAILPPDKMVKRLLPEAFIFYKPKDVVSGDFYWVEEKNGLIMFAAVDCTGHGVPGAMMSVVGLNLLNRAVKEKDLTVPADILQHLDMGVTDTLRQNREDETIKDGMDLSLCTYNPKTMQLQYAGAFNNLWVVRKNIAATYQPKTNEVIFEDSLLEVKADKFPIGSNTDGIADSYTNNTVQLQKGDCVYLYSDGFADQFGGPKGKKFKYNALKKLLISISHLSPDKQKEELNKTFENWKGNLEQIDDILVIGVSI